MTDKLQEITEKIYNEGVAEAEKEAEKIKEEARKEAEKIIRSAQKQASEIVETAKREAEELSKNAVSEMKLAARQFLSQLKQQVTHLVLARQIDPPVRENFSDGDFIRNIILTIIKNWNPAENDKMDLKLLVPEKDLDELTAFLNQQATDAMKKGLEIGVDAKLKNGFKLGPADDRFVIRFTDVDFENYFKTYFKEKTQKLIFGENE